VAHGAADLAMLAGLAGLAGHGGDTALALASSLSVLKFAAGGPLLPVFAVLGAVLLARRVAPHSRVRRREDGADPEIAAASELEPGTARRPDIVLPAAVADASTATVSATVGHAGPDVQRQLYAEEADDGAEAAPAAGDPGGPPAEVGICASGGGIRSASVTLGALQALRKDVLSRARYLVSVSGGGYMTGAFQLALTRANPEADSLATPGDVFAPGRPRRTTCAATAGTWPTAPASGWPRSGWCCAGSPPRSPC
jgi:hypothetical protein